jgi:hypothetical protein
MDTTPSARVSEFAARQRVQICDRAALEDLADGRACRWTRVLSEAYGAPGGETRYD